MNDQPKISREDLESKFSEIKTQVDDRTSILKDKVIPMAIIGGVVALALVYVIGKRVGNKKSAIVEIRRI